MYLDSQAPELMARLQRLAQRCVETETVTILGVPYLRIVFADGDELYVTELGLPYLEIIAPENVWLDKAHLAGNCHKLAGTSTVYRILPRNNPLKKEVVLKWNRMGQDVPGETRLLFPSAFNSPFEEFSLLLDLRQTRVARRGAVLPQKPLAIYIPHETSEPWQLGRKDSLMPEHQDIEIDRAKSYAVIYEWIKGLDLVQAHDQGLLSAEDVERITTEVDGILASEGYVVADRKPQHIIVRPHGEAKLRADKNGRPVMALIDFELLKRTPDFERLRRANSRREYLERQAHRFERSPRSMPTNLHASHHLGVDYVYGLVEGTDAELWVVGKDPALFEYFRPEKWRRTPRTKLSNVNQTYHTRTKDDINMVWKVSRVGEIACVDPSSETNRAIHTHGFNSPFEEARLAIEFARRGIGAIYPRAIYMTGHRSQMLDILADGRRYETHRHMNTPLGRPILRPDRDYITLWGYWNGLDQDLCIDDDHHLTPISAFLAFHHRYISEEQYLSLLKRQAERLAAAGFEDLNLKGSHLILSLSEDRRLMLDDAGLPLVRMCNFELVREITPTAHPPEPEMTEPVTAL